MPSKPVSDFTPAPIKPTTPLSVLERIDVRVGRILAVENYPDLASS